MSEQEKLIGPHPINHEFFSRLLKSEDIPATSNKRHRKLSENNNNSIEQAIDLISDWIIKHHLSDDTIARKKNVYKKNGLNKLSERILGLPDDYITKKGNFAEIILCEYLVSTSKLIPLVYRLRYNPNINQSMKGDDVLLLDTNNFKKIIIGEAKFRTIPNKPVVDEIIEGFKKHNSLPISLPFIATMLEKEGNLDLSEKIEELNFSNTIDDVNIVNAGFLLSNNDTAHIIEKHGDSDNKKLILISLGIPNPEDIVMKSFESAIKKLKAKINET
ncbi:MAG: DUF1837 domain-containing protein [Deltaproteobacteria bacterium]|jgi:hypothetical protein|nr:DUF1837 domain-containing protein [Deltaproteobacteria bacterium]